jgi:hypothetical protein
MSRRATASGPLGASATVKQTMHRHPFSHHRAILTTKRLMLRRRCESSTMINTPQHRGKPDEGDETTHNQETMLSQDRSQTGDRLVSTSNGLTEMQTQPKAGTELAGKGFVRPKSSQHGTIPSGARVYQWCAVLPFRGGQQWPAMHQMANPPSRLLLLGRRSIRLDVPQPRPEEGALRPNAACRPSECIQGGPEFGPNQPF